MLNLKPILQLQNHQAMTDTYKSIQYRLDDFQEDSVVDTAGFFGTHHRMIEKHTQQLTPLQNLKLILKVISEDNKIVEIMRTIRQIDKDRNGFVTDQELEDILKLFYR